MCLLRTCALRKFSTLHSYALKGGATIAAICTLGSSVFRNASSASACSSSNTHSVVIAPILLGKQGPPTGNLRAPCPPLPLPLDKQVVSHLPASRYSICGDDTDMPISLNECNNCSELPNAGYFKP